MTSNFESHYVVQCSLLFFPECLQKFFILLLLLSVPCCNCKPWRARPPLASNASFVEKVTFLSCFCTSTNCENVCLKEVNVYFPLRTTTRTTKRKPKAYAQFYSLLFKHSMPYLTTPSTPCITNTANNN